MIDQADRVVGFTKDTSFTTDGSGSKYGVKAVNEYGSLSQPSTVDTATGINSVQESCLTLQGYYNLQGIRTVQPSRGLNIVSYVTADGRRINKMVCR